MAVTVPDPQPIFNPPDNPMPAPNCPIPEGMATHGIVKPPNMEGPHGNRLNNGNSSLAHSASPVHPANEAHAHGDRRNGTMPLTGHASPVKGSDHEYDLGMSYDHWPTPVQSGGHGAIPVSPFKAGSGTPKTALPVSEMGRPKGR